MRGGCNKPETTLRPPPRRDSRALTRWLSDLENAGQPSIDAARVPFRRSAVRWSSTHRGVHDARVHVDYESERRRERGEAAAGTIDLPLVWRRASASNRDWTAIEAEKARKLAPEKNVGQREVIAFAPRLGDDVFDLLERGDPDLFTCALAEPR